MFVSHRVVNCLLLQNFYKKKLSQNCHRWGNLCVVWTNVCINTRVVGYQDFSRQEVYGIFCNQGTVAVSLESEGVFSPFFKFSAVYFMSPELVSVVQHQMAFSHCENPWSLLYWIDSHKTEKAVWWWTIEINSGLVKNNHRWEQCKNSWKFFLSGSL